jgi:chain length determinant protein EpsF
MNLKQIFLLLKLRWWLVLALFALIVTVTTAVSLVMPKQYTASMQVLLDVKTDPLLERLMPNLAAPGYMVTQAEIIRSERVATRVVKMLGLAENPVAVEQWRDDTAGRVPLESYYGEVLLRSLKVEAIPQSSMLGVSYTASEPKFAAAVTNAFTKGYLDLTVEMRRNPGQEATGFIDARLATLRSELQAAQDRLSAFQQKKGIVISPERIDMEQQRLTALELELVKAMSESVDANSKTRNGGNLGSVDVLSSSVVQGLKSQLAAGETKLKEVSETYGSRHPIRMALEAQVAELKQQLAREARTVGEGSASQGRIATQRVAELRNLIEQQKRTVLGARGERDEASVLLKDVETARAAYDQVASKRSQVVTETLSDQAAARVLSPAVEPLNHSKPNVPKNIFAAVAMGLLIGMAAAIGWELLDRRIRSEDDLLVVEGVPVIGILSSKPLDAKSRLLPSPVKRMQANFPPQLTLDGGAT